MTMNTELRRADARLTFLCDAVDSEDWPRAMRLVASLAEGLATLAPALVAEGIRSGMSQADCARQLDVPPSALRGAKQAFLERTE